VRSALSVLPTGGMVRVFGRPLSRQYADGTTIRTGDIVLYGQHLCVVLKANGIRGATIFDLLVSGLPDDMPEYKKFRDRCYHPYADFLAPLRRCDSKMSWQTWKEKFQPTCNVFLRQHANVIVSTAAVNRILAAKASQVSGKQKDKILKLQKH